LSKPPKIFGSLLTEIVNTGLCMYCGSCIASCPVNVVSYTDDEKPTLVGRCVLCELCYYGCPRVEFPLADVERSTFGRTRDADEPVGVKVGIYSARSTDEKILAKSQDGGVVTGLLRYALEKKLIDHAILVGKDSKEPWRPFPTIASMDDEVLLNAGSKYSATGSLGGLAEATVGYPNSRLAFVGMPCQIQALRRVATSPHGARKLTEPVKLAIGLFCYNTYKYGPLFVSYIKEQQKLDLGKITKIEIRSGRLKAYYGAEARLDVPVGNLESYTLLGCSKCQDFTAELADISIGHEGSEVGWCTVITRTQEASNLLQSAAKAGALQLRAADEIFPSVVKLSESKRRREAPYIRG